MGEATAAGRFPLDTVLPDYEFLGELGRGAMGVVLSARHRTLGRTVAVKELPPTFAADPEVRRRFLQEGRTLAALDHPHVVIVHDFVERDGRLALVMEQLAGGTVWDLFTTKGVTAPVACGLLLSVASGLDHAHRHQVLHRDVKPENLMFTAAGQLKVTDFGMAKVLGGDRTLATAEGVVLGTPAYMAPEQAEGAPIGPEADVYACGTMLHELLCGRLPFAEATTAVAMLVARVKDEAPPIRSRAPDVPRAVAEVVDRAVARSRNDRFASVEEFAVALGRAAATSWGPAWLDTTGVTVTGSAAIERASRSSLRPPASPSGAGPTTGGDGDAGRGPAPDTVIDLRSDDPGRSQPAVRATGAARLAAPDLRSLAPEQMVDVALVGSLASAMTFSGAPVRPGRPRAARWWTAGCLVAALVAFGVMTAAFVGAEPPASSPSIRIGGAPAGPEVLSVDLARPLVVDGLRPASVARLRVSSNGVPLGVARSPVKEGRATFEAGYLRWTTAGVVDLAITLDDETTPAHRAAVVPLHPWWSTAPAAAVALLGLLAAASMSARLGSLRRTTAVIGPAIGLGVAVALLAVAVTAALTLWLQVRPAPDALGLGAAAAGVAAACAALARPRRRARAVVTTWV